MKVPGASLLCMRLGDVARNHLTTNRLSTSSRDHDSKCFVFQRRLDEVTFTRYRYINVELLHSTMNQLEALPAISVPLFRHSPVSTPVHATLRKLPHVSAPNIHA